MSKGLGAGHPNIPGSVRKTLSPQLPSCTGDVVALLAVMQMRGVLALQLLWAFTRLVSTLPQLPLSKVGGKGAQGCCWQLLGLTGTVETECVAWVMVVWVMVAWVVSSSDWAEQKLRAGEVEYKEQERDEQEQHDRNAQLSSLPSW